MTDRSQSQSSNSLYLDFLIFLFNTFLSLPSFLNVEKGKGNGHIIPTTNTSNSKELFTLLLLFWPKNCHSSVRKCKQTKLFAPEFSSLTDSFVQVGLVFPCQKILLLEKRSSWMTTEASKVSVVVCEDDAGLSTI